MKNTTIRISSELLDNIKLTKSVLGGSTYEDVLAKLVKNELMKTFAYTDSGYLPVGAVVTLSNKKPLVITQVDKDRVLFSNQSSLINGSAFCRKLVLLARSVDTYEDSFTSEL